MDSAGRSLPIPELSSLRYTGTKAFNSLNNDPLFNVTNKRHLKRLFSNLAFEYTYLLLI